MGNPVRFIVVVVWEDYAEVLQISDGKLRRVRYANESEVKSLVAAAVAAACKLRANTSILFMDEEDSIHEVREQIAREYGVELDI